MKKQNQRLTIIAAVLLAANFGFLLIGGKGRSIGYDESRFSVDSPGMLTEIIIGDIRLVKSGEQWLVGDLPADKGIVDIVLRVMNRVRVSKPVEDMDVAGIPVMMKGGKIDLKFEVIGNDTKTRTYFRDSEGTYEVEIPGYSDYVGGIFELKRDQWRDRLLVDANWRTIQVLTLDYMVDDKQDFTIRFDKKFFMVDGLSKVDTTFVVDYLNQFEYFQANERISRGTVLSLDSLMGTRPLASLTLEHIGSHEPFRMTIFPREPGRNYHLVLDAQNEMVVIDAARMREILAERERFRAR
jgi:hypothetical protein